MAGSPKRQALLSAAQALCSDFATGAPMSTLLSRFSSEEKGTQPTAFEHGHESLAPFLGRHFLGQGKISEYFELLGRHLTFSDMVFRDYVVDEVEQVVCLKAESRIVWKETEKGWHEEFTYRLRYVEEDGEWKISQYELWADSGSTYLARIGEEPGRQTR